MTNLPSAVLVSVGLLALAVFVYGLLCPRRTADPDALLDWQRSLVAAIRRSGGQGLLCERNYHYSSGFPPSSRQGRCFSRAVAVEFVPASGWWVLFEYQGCIGLTRQFLHPAMDDDAIRIADDQEREPSEFRGTQLVRL